MTRKHRASCVAAAGVIALGLLACREKRKSSSPPAKATAPATKTTTTSTAALERAEIQAGKDSNGLQRRAIVRQAPQFGAAEVARLQSGTAIGVVQHLSAGWLEIRWPHPSGANTGYVHRDVVSLGASNNVRSPPSPPVDRPGGPCPQSREATTTPCRCPDGHNSTMVCLGRSLTWSACYCS